MNCTTKEMVQLVTIKYPNGNLARRYTLKNGEYHGIYQEWWGDTTKLYTSRSYVDGILDGPYEEWYGKGNYEPKSNKCKKFYPPGIYEACTYVNGKREGLAEGWYGNGNKWYEYIEEKDENVYLSWNEDGSFKDIRYYKRIKDGDDNKRVPIYKTYTEELTTKYREQLMEILSDEDNRLKRLEDLYKTNGIE